MIEQFKAEASMASFHYADDTCREWSRAKERADEAVRLYKLASNDEQEEMRSYMKKQLWNHQFLKEIA